MAETILTRKELRAVSRELRAQGLKIPKYARCLVLPPALAKQLGGKTLCHGGIHSVRGPSPKKDATDFWVRDY